MSRVLIIEPHGDDALISCSRVLRGGHEVTILTLSQRDSAGLSSEFKSVCNVSFLNIEDFHWNNRPVDHNQVNRWYKAGENTFKKYVESLEDNVEYYDHVVSVKRVLQNYLKSKGDFDWIFVPLGITHPYHIAVRVAFDNMNYTTGCPVVYYSEGPYNGKKYGLKMERDAETLGDLVTVTVPHDEDWVDEKKRIYSKLYPTETHLFRFSHDEVLRNSDRYLTLGRNREKLESLLEVTSE